MVSAATYAKEETYTMSTSSMLFTGGDLTEHLRTRTASALRQVDDWNGDQLLQIPAADVVAHVVSEYALDCPRLETDQAEQLPPGETVQTVRGMLSGTNIRQRQTRLTVIVPFSGDPVVFQLTPTSFTLNPPRGTVLDGEIHLVWEGVEGQSEAIQRHFDEQITAIDKWLTSSRKSIDAFNAALRTQVAGRVEQRRATLLADRHLGASLSFPMRKREDAATFAVPVVRKKITIARPTATGHFHPEPALDDANYEEVLQILRNAVIALERSPSMTAKLGEPEIRDLLLAFLNSQTEIAGQATGETFNGNGKTDILIRIDGRNVFIGEAKFWDGPSKWTDAINQLLGYTTWRDTKAALLLFMRDGTPSHIISEGIKSIESHPNYKRTVDKTRPDDRADFIMHANGDPNREIKLAQLPFHLPSAETIQRLKQTS